MATSKHQIKVHKPVHEPKEVQGSEIHHPKGLKHPKLGQEWDEGQETAKKGNQNWDDGRNAETPDVYETAMKPKAKKIID